jgi:excisionase family DNA binding protein
MEKLLSVQEVAELLAIPVPTVYRWRYEGTGPVGLKVGRHVRYDPAELRRWLAEHRDDCAPADA